MFQPISNPRKIFVAMSGGVDSSVAALLLKRAGHAVTGVFMKNWSETKDPSGECSWRGERRDAERVAATLGIPFLTFDFKTAYHDQVVARMDREYALGRTPNPDVMCNEKIKFDLFYRQAKELGADAIATGHYARTLDGEMQKAVDQNKDQTYFLYRIKPEVLCETHFPIGDFLKSEVRELARAAGLATAEKKDSQGLCFVGKVKMREFLKRRLESQPGQVLDTAGRVLGTHEGAAFYTIGQRHGLNLGLEKEYYVVARDTVKNIVTVSEHKDDPQLMKKEIEIADTRWLKEVKDGERVEARIRYREPLAVAQLKKLDGDHWLVIFDEAQWAASPGQSVVCYLGDVVLGGGIIC